MPSTTRRRLVAIPFASLLVAPHAALARALSVDGVAFLATGLNNPRGFTWNADGALVVAEAGIGGDTRVSRNDREVPFLGGETSRIVTIADGCAAPVIEELPSAFWESRQWVWGVMDVAWLGDTLFALHGGGPQGWGLPESPVGVYRVEGDGTWTLVADLAAWFADNEPAVRPGDYDSNGSVFGMQADGERLWVTESNGGRLMTVSPEGEIALIADLSADPAQTPTGLALDGEGGAYVAYLTVIPYPQGGARVVHVDAEGTVTDHWTGLTTVNDVAVSPDGTLYAAEMASETGPEAPFIAPGTGRVVRMTGSDAHEVVVEGLDTPVGIGFSPDGGLVVSGPAFVPGSRGEGAGWLMQVDVNAAPVDMTGIEIPESTCAE